MSAEEWKQLKEHIDEFLALYYVQCKYKGEKE